MELRPIIQSFVTGILGCGCPDSVFEQIECSRMQAIPGLTKPIWRLLIGRRLLVYFLEADGCEISSVLPQSLEMGIAERNRNGYNRLRLVIVTNRPEPIRQEAQSLFAGVAGADEKAHLHLLPAEEDWERLCETMAGFDDPSTA